MALPGQWRFVEALDDGHVRCQLLCCSQYTSACEYEVATWKVCPFCGCALVAKRECRNRNVPVWAHKRGINPWDTEYPKIPKQSTYSLETMDRNGNWYTMLGYMGATKERVLELFRQEMAEQREEWQPYQTHWRLRFGSAVWRPTWATIPKTGE